MSVSWQSVSEGEYVKGQPVAETMQSVRAASVGVIEALAPLLTS
jgi:hypothetical protein